MLIPTWATFYYILALPALLVPSPSFTAIRAESTSLLSSGATNIKSEALEQSRARFCLPTIQNTLPMVSLRAISGSLVLVLSFAKQRCFASAESINSTKLNSISTNNGTLFLGNNHTVFDAPPVFSSEATDDLPPLEDTLSLSPNSSLIPVEFEDEDELIYFENGQLSNASTDNNSSSSTCAATLNARNDLCAKHLRQLREASGGEMVPCDCYNFCNGRLLGCLDFGARVTFACTGSLVAGCEKEQLQYFVHDDTGTDTSNAYSAHRSDAWNAFIMGGLVTVLCLGSGIWI